METKLIVFDSKHKKRAMEEAAELIKSGDIVAFPTETVYGLGANAFDENAVAKIFAAKGRPADNPLIVHIAKKDQLSEIVLEVPLIAKKLIKKFWPGPLTIVFKKSQKIPSNVTAGLDTVAVRMPAHKVALDLIKKAGVPIAAPSANSSTRPSPTCAQHVYDDLNGKIPYIIDGGTCKVGLESTVLSLANEKAIILRPGKVTLEQIQKTIGKLGKVSVANQLINNQTPSSPGMKYRHYSPTAEVILVENGNDFEKKVFENSSDKKVGVISFSKELGLRDEFFFDKSLTAYARSLFSALRELDDRCVDVIIVEGVEEKALGLAIMNRLRKAASKII